jgi:hypothetical protein
LSEQVYPELDDVMKKVFPLMSEPVTQSLSFPATGSELHVFADNVSLCVQLPPDAL